MGSRARSARPSASWSSTRRTSRPAPASRGRSRPSTTASCARCCTSRPTPSSRPRRSTGAAGTIGAHRPRRPAAPLVVDALGWRRVLGAADGYQPPDAPLSRGLEVHPVARRRAGDLDRPRLRAGRLRLELPGADEVRVGVGSFDPRFHVKEPTVGLASDLERDAVRYQGNWIPHRLRAGDRRRGLLRRRLRRPLPAADRGGNPHRLLLRHRLRARAARGGRRPQRRARRRCAATRASRPRTAGSSRRCCASSGWCRGSRRAAGAGAPRDGPSASCAGRSATTSRSRRPSTRGRRPAGSARAERAAA